jgi:hypothetical protein
MSPRPFFVRRSIRRVRHQLHARRHRQLWAPEGLEDRVLLAATLFAVNAITDTGAGSGTTGDLRYCIDQANANSNTDGSVIEFDPTVFVSPQTITLSSTIGTLDLTESGGPEVIQGPGANLLTLSGNNAVGVFQVASGVTATLLGLTISDGSAINGGGINNAGSLTVTDSVVANNGANNDGGGVENTGSLALSGSTIANNNAGGGGGGIDNSGTLTVTDSTIAYNFICCGVASGGGIENTGTLMLTNSTISDNSANGNGVGDNGGGIDNAGTLTAFDTTIAYNMGGKLGGGLYDEPGAATTLDNTIVALNSFSFDAIGNEVNFDPLYDYDIGGGLLSSASAYNLIGTGGSGGLTNGINGNQVGVANPGLARLANNGGPTQTIGLLPGSPGINVGSNALVPAGVTTDQRGAGFARFVNGNVDIGAFEQPIVSGGPTVYTVTNTSSDLNVTGSLPWAINQANNQGNTGYSPANLNGSVIEFDPTVFNSSSSQTITLTSTLDLSEQSWPEVIQGPGANALTISGNNEVTVFQVESSTTAALSGLTVTDGYQGVSYQLPFNEGGADGGGILNFGTVTVTNCTVTHNSAPVVGFAGFGGGIGNDLGCLTLLSAHHDRIFPEFPLVESHV